MANSQSQSVGRSPVLSPGVAEADDPFQHLEAPSLASALNTNNSRHHHSSPRLLKSRATTTKFSPNKAGSSMSVLNRSSSSPLETRRGKPSIFGGKYTFNRGYKAEYRQHLEQQERAVGLGHKEALVGQDSDDTPPLSGEKALKPTTEEIFKKQMGDSIGRAATSFAAPPPLSKTSLSNTTKSKPKRIGSAGTTHSLLTISSAATFLTTPDEEEIRPSSFIQPLTSTTLNNDHKVGSGAVVSPPLGLRPATSHSLLPHSHGPQKQQSQQRTAPSSFVKSVGAPEVGVPTISPMAALMNSDLQDAFEPIQEPIPGGKPPVLLPSMTRDSKRDANLGKEEGEGTTGDSSPKLTSDQLMAQMMKQFEQRGALMGKSSTVDDKKRKQEGKKLMNPLEPAHSVRRGHTLTMITKLRKDQEAMNDFSSMCDEILAERSEKFKAQLTFQAKDRHREALKALVPEVRSKKLAESAFARDERIEKAKEKRAEFREEKQKKREASLTRTFTASVPLRPIEYRLDDVSWMTMLAAAVFAQRLNTQLVKERRHIEIIKKQELDMEKAVRVLCRIQKWWRRYRWVLLVRRRRQKLVMVKNILKGADKIRVQFSLAMKRMLQAILRIQRHVRAVRRVRARRLEHAVSLLDEIIKDEIKDTELQINLSFKERSVNEAKARAAIKQRKPEFEGRMKKAEKKIAELKKAKNIYNCLTEKSKKDMVVPLLEDKYKVYKKQVAEIAKRMFDKFQANYNKKGLLSRKATIYHDDLSKKSICDLRITTQDTLKTMSTAIFEVPEGLSLSLSREEAEDAFADLGWEYGLEDYEDQKEAIAQAEEEELKRTLSRSQQREAVGGGQRLSQSDLTRPPGWDDPRRGSTATKQLRRRSATNSIATKKPVLDLGGSDILAVSTLGGSPTKSSSSLLSTSHNRVGRSSSPSRPNSKLSTRR